MTEREKKIVFSSLIQSNNLRDSLDMMKGMGLNTGKLKSARNAFHVQLSSYLNKVYSKDGDLSWLNDTISVESEISILVSDMEYDEKVKLLKTIKDASN